MVEMSDLDEEAAVNERSAATLSRGNDAAIQAGQINCAGWKGGRKEGRKEGRGHEQQIYSEDRRVTMMLNFNLQR